MNKKLNSGVVGLIDSELVGSSFTRKRWSIVLGLKGIRPISLNNDMIVF